MADFKKAIPIILKHEGGYVNDPKDPGGETKFGISKRAFPLLDIKNLTLDKAQEIYKENYWNPINGDLIKSQDIATNLFDFVVNAGISSGVKTIQKVLNVATDGKLGPGTLAAINACDEKILNMDFTKARFEYYKSIVVKNPDLNKFLVGWKKRCESFVTLEA